MERVNRVTRVSTLGAAAALVAALLGGCTKAGGDEQSATPAPLPEDMPVCTDLFANGKTVERDHFGEACKGDDGQLAVPRPVTLECTDGRVFLWNKYAWGYVDEAMTLIQSGINDKEPVDEAMECLKRAPGSTGGTGAATTTTTAP
jgi:hypothetical protein